jgi:membrane protease YdiL (CAAX protease family)
LAWQGNSGGTVSVVGSPPVVRPWTVRDFIVIWFGGVVGSTIFGSIAVAVGGNDLVILLALAGQYSGNLVVYWLYARDGRRGDIGFQMEPTDFLYVAAGFVFQIAIAFLFLPLSRWLFPNGEAPQEVVDMITGASSQGVKLGLVAGAVILAPVTEELLFRGVLLKALEGKGERFALYTSAAIFAAAHILGLDLDRLWQSAVVVLPPLFVLGLVLARITQRSGRLGPAIMLHSGWNLLAAFVLLLPPDVLNQIN